MLGKSGDIFMKMAKLMEMGSVIQKRLLNKELMIPESTEELKQLIKLKASELASSEESSDVVKVKKTPDKILIYDLLTLLYHLLERVEEVD